MKDRIKAIRKEAGLTQEQFGDRIGVGKMTVTYYEGDKRTPSLSTLKVICNEFNVNETWLLTGEGEMKAPPTRQQEIAEIVAKLHSLDMEDPADQLLYDIEAWLAKLPKSVWNEFYEFIKDEIPKLHLK